MAQLAVVLVTSCAPRGTELGVLPELDEVCPNHAHPSGRLRGGRPVEVPAERHVFFSAGV